MNGAFIKTKTTMVVVQENGIIRDHTSMAIIGRLNVETEFTDISNLVRICPECNIQELRVEGRFLECDECGYLEELKLTSQETKSPSHKEIMANYIMLVKDSLVFSEEDFRGTIVDAIIFLLKAIDTLPDEV